MRGMVVCERCHRHIEKVKRVCLTFVEDNGIRSHEWQSALAYALCTDCAHEMRRKLVDTAIRVIEMHSTRRDKKELRQ